MLLYIGAVVDLVFGSYLGALALVIIAGRVAAGGAVASEKRWGYQLAVGLALAPLVLATLALGVDVVQFGVLLALAFDILLAVLLLHPESREYQRIWFR